MMTTEEDHRRIAQILDKFKVTDKSKACMHAIHSRSDLSRLLSETLHHGDNRSIHLHFLDFATIPVDQSDLTKGLTCEPANADMLKRDLESMSKFTDGLFITWSGHKHMKPSDKKTLMYNTFYKLFNDDAETFRDDRSMVLALPTMEAESQDANGGDTTPEHARRQDGPKTTHHRLIPKSSVGGFEQGLWQTLIFSSQGEEKTPVVCVLVNGWKESLTTALAAVKSGIPLVIMKGSGGLADILAHLHEGATPRTKRLRIDGTLKTITILEPDQATLDKVQTNGLFKNDRDLINDFLELCDHLHLLTVYHPHGKENPLDRVVLEALIKNNKEDQIAGLLKTIKKHADGSDESEKREGSLISGNAVDMNFFVDSLLAHSLTAVSTFLTVWGIDFFNFDQAKLLRLYSKELRFVDESGGEPLLPYERYKRARGELKAFVKAVSSDYPLRCSEGSSSHCSECTLCQVTGNPQEHGQTCLHPVQELFLWSLLSRDTELSEAFWEHCDDKMAAALFARAFFRGVGSREKNADIKRELTEYADHFEDLAVQTLKAARGLDEFKTRQLLTKPCPWWGGVSAMEVAVLTESQLFIAQDSCQQQLGISWAGKDKENTSALSCFLSSHQWQPRLTYFLSLGYQIGFLLLFGFTLLFDLSPSSTPVITHGWFIIVVVWVLDTAVEEFRQALTDDSPTAPRQETRSTHDNVKAYFSQSWNKLDALSIAFFVVGFVLLMVPNDIAFLVGRFFMAADYMFFMLRFLQMLVFFKWLGVFLVVAMEMLKDSVRFMVIILTIMAGYTVAMEAILYPELSCTWEKVFSLPARSYWQSFGELGLDTFQDEDCSPASSDCASPFAQKAATIMVAIYMVINHVLLFNLLIAWFSSTYEKEREIADQHQAWQRCQLVREFQNRSPLPPPFNLLVACLRIGHRRLLRSRRAQSGPDDTPLSDVNTLTQDVEGTCGRCVTVTTSESNDEPIEVTVSHLNAMHVGIGLCTFHLGAGCKQLFLWKDGPKSNMDITATRSGQECTVTAPSGSAEKEKMIELNYKLHKFEDEQAKYVLSTNKCTNDHTE